MLLALEITNKSKQILCIKHDYYEFFGQFMSLIPEKKIF